MRIKNIDNKKFVYLLCNRLRQPIGDIYSTSIEANILKFIAFSNPRVLIGITEEGEEIYQGIQRTLSPNRVKEIKKYVNEYEYATFPSSIILNIPHEKLDIYDVDVSYKICEEFGDSNYKKPDSIENFSKMVLLVFPFEESIAQIIDGQHRMSGFIDEKEMLFDLPVTIFVDQLVEQQAEIFSTINGKQTRVTSSLVYELFGLSTRSSPYKTAHNIIVALNDSEESPIKNWIKRLGKSNKYYKGYVTQSTANQNLLKLICGNVKQADEDMRVMAKGEAPESRTVFSANKPVLREFFVDGKEDAIIKILFNYFRALESLFAVEWAKEDSIFKKTIGFSALFKVLNDLISIGLKKQDLSYDFFISVLSGVEINSAIVSISSKGVNELYMQFFSFYKEKKDS